jgi:hypothetical protein
MSDTSPANDDRAAAIARWLAAAEADADERGLPELKPLLQGLAASTTALRAADWGDDAGASPPPRARRIGHERLAGRDHR